MMRRYLMPALALAALLPLTGCHSDGPDGGMDMNYLRTPDIDEQSKPVVTEPLALLFPTGPTRRWQLRVSAMGKQTGEIVRVSPATNFREVSNALTLTMYQNGKEYRSEVYQLKPESLSLVAAGGADKMVMNPPMLLLKAQAPEGAVYKWEGNIKFKGSNAPAQAFSRVHARQEIETPAGKFTAYRVDTSLTTIIEGKPITFPASRWFAPGVGIVKQTFRVGSALVEKDVVSYTGG